jgi:hypothetical protein
LPGTLIRAVRVDHVELVLTPQDGPNRYAPVDPPLWGRPFVSRAPGSARRHESEPGPCRRCTKTGACRSDRWPRAANRRRPGRGAHLGSVAAHSGRAERPRVPASPIGEPLIIGPYLGPYPSHLAPVRPCFPVECGGGVTTRNPLLRLHERCVTVGVCVVWWERVGVPGGQGVAGSNPASPTDEDLVAVAPAGCSTSGACPPRPTPVASLRREQK